MWSQFLIFLLKVGTTIITVFVSNLDVRHLRSIIIRITNLAWDYKTAELGAYRLNFTTSFLDLMAKVGLAYDLKTATPDMISNRIDRTGDGTKTNIWGFSDVDQTDEDKKFVKIIRKDFEQFE